MGEDGKDDKVQPGENRHEPGSEEEYKRQGKEQFSAGSKEVSQRQTEDGLQMLKGTQTVMPGDIWCGNADAGEAQCLRCRNKAQILHLLPSD